MPKLAIFDLDGTLIHFPFSYLFSETQRILKLFGHPDVSQEDLEESFSSFEYFRVVQYGLNINWSSEEDFQAKFWTEFNWIDYPKAQVFDDTIDLLARIDSLGYKIAIATARASSASEIEKDLLDTGILPYVSSIKTRASDRDNWKDKSSQIRSILTEFGILADQAIMIGDVPSDIESARAENLKAAYGVLTGGIRRDVLLASEPSEIFSNLYDLKTSLFK
jgi:phosphoglycolate phosphatase-like HAD superfamily hydrolase